MKLAWMKGTIIALALAVGFGAYFLSGKADGMIEQGAEAILRAHGIDIDISPGDT